MKLQCPVCGAFIEGDSVNVAADIAKCGECGEVFKPSELLKRTTQEENLDPPKGGRIAFSMEAGSTAVFQIPRRRISGADVGTMGFTAFWLGFIAFWTWGAAHGSIAFALFSIPFWIVGLGMAGGILNSLLERETLELTDDELRIFKIRPLMPRRYFIPYADIESISMEGTLPRDAVTAMRYMQRLKATPEGGFAVSVPTVAYGVRKTRFAETVSEAEAKWLVAVIRAAVQNKTGKWT